MKRFSIGARSLCVLLCALAACGVLAAQELMWEQMRGPNSGEVQKIIFLPSGEMVCNVRSLGILHSGDQGETWSRPVQDTRHFELLTRLEETGVLFARSGNTFWYSEDGGRNWQGTAGGSPIPGEASMPVGNHLGRYFTAALATPQGAIFLGTSGGLYRTDNRGNTWQPVHEHFRDVQVYALAVAHNGTLYAATDSLGVGISADEGQTWNFKQLPGNFARGSVYSLAVGRSGLVFAGNRNGLYRSTDHGASWTRFASEFSDNVTDLQIAPDGTIYAGVYMQGVYRIDTVGNAMLLDLATRYIVGLFLHPEGSLFAATQYNGIFRTSDNGAGWQNLGWPLATPFHFTTGPEGALYAAAGLYSVHKFDTTTDRWSSIGGKMFEYPRGDPSSATENCVAVDPDGTVYSADYHEVRRIDDSPTRQTVVLRPPGHSSTYFHSLLMTPEGNLVAANLQRVYVSGDLAYRWDTLQPDPEGRLYCLEYDHGASWELVVGGEGAIYRSVFFVDGWTNTTLNNAGAVRALISDHKGKLYALQQIDKHVAQLLYSVDSAGSWQEFGERLEAGSIYDIVLDQNGVLYAAGDSGVYYFSPAENEQLWRPFNLGLPQKQAVRALHVYRDNQLIAGVTDHGAWRTVPYIVSVSRDSSSGTLPELKAQPNPFTGVLHLEFTLKQAGEIRLEIRDLLGNLAALPGQGWYNAGKHTLKLHAGAFPGGSYFAVLHSGKQRVAQHLVKFP